MKSCTPPWTKLTLAVDFHGVICSYKSGWKGDRVAYDPPTQGAFEFLQAATEHFHVAIVCARFSNQEAIQSALEWFQRYKFPIPITVDPNKTGSIYLCKTKPACHVLLDDRAVTFDGTFPEIGSLVNFKPWNR